MNKVFVNVQGVGLPSWGGKVSEFAVKVINELNYNNWELSVLLCDDVTITGLNREYRNKNEATDVLSFELGETMQNGENAVYLPGDIVISLDSLRENAKYFEIPEDEELRRLLIHGILHLDGMDHTGAIRNINQNEPMLILQEKIMDKLKGEYIMSKNNGGNY